MANEFGLGSLSLETKKPNITAWINKAKPYFVDLIGDTLQGDLDMNNFKVTNLKSPENYTDAVHKRYLRDQINSIEKEERLADPGSRGEDSDGVEGEDESESEKRRGVYSLRERLPMSAGLGVGELRARVGVWFGSVVSLDGTGRSAMGWDIAGWVGWWSAIDKTYIHIINLTLVEFFSLSRVQKETKELEINDENNKAYHLYEIKTSGKYIDRFRMLIIPVNEEDELSLSEFDMILEMETSPSMNIIRNPEPEKEGWYYLYHYNKEMVEEEWYESTRMVPKHTEKENVEKVYSHTHPFIRYFIRQSIKGGRVSANRKSFETNKMDEICNVLKEYTELENSNIIDLFKEYSKSKKDKTEVNSKLKKIKCTELMAFDTNGLYASATSDLDSEYPKAESAREFLPEEEEEFVKLFNEQKFRTRTAILKV
ncbi:hypothetical protein LOTGIDRAFT_157245 [Lottia gigantea]|uniref:DNA-directed DNA polymerase n=1 Tax=Lottia gigantea TaxID=225164 RepID=V4B3W4_LOTGI|nr:hypothetical protein LOTGIDRAFT_157245 [Lottia gigantea]ESP02096.1 hypothetical protein LOTGIDRAFT_157245 [Lottia gigantea]